VLAGRATMGFEGPVRVARAHARARVFDGAGRIGDLPRVPGASAGSETRSVFDAGSVDITEDIRNKSLTICRGNMP